MDGLLSLLGDLVYTRVLPSVWRGLRESRDRRRLCGRRGVASSNAPPWTLCSSWATAEPPRWESLWWRFRFTMTSDDDYAMLHPDHCSWDGLSQFTDSEVCLTSSEVVLHYRSARPKRKFVLPKFDGWMWWWRRRVRSHKQHDDVDKWRKKNPRQVHCPSNALVLSHLRRPTQERARKWAHGGTVVGMVYCQQ
jgi:hypothetical protein